MSLDRGLCGLRSTGFIFCIRSKHGTKVPYVFLWGVFIPALKSGAITKNCCFKVCNNPQRLCYFFFHTLATRFNAWITNNIRILCGTLVPCVPGGLPSYYSEIKFYFLHPVPSLQRLAPVAVKKFPALRGNISLHFCTFNQHRYTGLVKPHPQQCKVYNHYFSDNSFPQILNRSRIIYKPKKQ